MGLFDDVLSSVNDFISIFGGESGGGGGGGGGVTAGGVIGSALQLGQTEFRRSAAREQTRALRREAGAVARQGGELVTETQRRAQRLAASQRAVFGATGLNLTGGDIGSPGAVLLETSRESLRQQQFIRSRTDNAVDRLLRQGRAIRRSANRARNLGFAGAFVNLISQE